MTRLPAAAPSLGSTAVSAPIALTPASDALFRPVRTGNAFEETVERLLTAIKLGIVEPGTRLPPERELAERLSVSRVTLREAIVVLRQSGWVESRRGRYGGTFVNQVLPKLTQTAARRLARSTGFDLEDTLLLRQVLETGAAEQAAERAGSETGIDPAGLRFYLDECRRAKDLAEYRRLDSRFHLAVAEAAGSPSLTAAVAGSRMKVNSFLDAIPVLDRNVANSDDQHRRVVLAIVSGDRPGARQAMAEHLSATAALLRGFLG